jgi:hypothetical protein
VARHLWEALNQLQPQQALTVHAWAPGVVPGSCISASWPSMEQRASEAQLGPGECLAAPDYALSLCRPELSPKEAHAAWDAQLGRTSGVPGSYHVAVVPPGPGSGPKPSLVIGQYRGAILQLPGGAGEAAQGLLLQALGSAAPALSAAFLAAARGPEAAGGPGGQPPLSAAGEAILSFSLCNADSAAPSGPPAAAASGGPAFYGWRFEPFQRRYLAPFIEALRESCAVRVSVESQVLLFAPSKEKGAWSEELGGFAVPHARLASFVDGRWGLNTGGNALPEAASGGLAGLPSGELPSSSGPSSEQGPRAEATLGIPPHVLHFVAYVPPRDRRPLLLLRPGGGASETNGFWIPSWGGVHVVNPAELGTEERARSGEDRAAVGGGSLGAPRATSNVSAPLGEPEMRRFAGVAVSQLRALLGVDLRERLLERHGARQQRQEEAAPFELRVLPAPRAGVSTWELDALARGLATSNAEAAARVLGSLSRLVEQLPGLEMPGLIGKQVEAALDALRGSARAARGGRYDEAAALAWRARGEAEAAFSNPSVLAQLSYPPSHAVGVYVPFFLPVAMVLLQAVIGEVKHARLRRTRSLKAELDPGGLGSGLAPTGHSSEHSAAG